MPREEELDEELQELLDEGSGSGKAKLFATLAVSAVLGVAGGTFVLPSFLSGSSPDEQEATVEPAPAEPQPEAHAPAPADDGPESPGGGHEVSESVGRLMSISNLVVNARGTEGSRLLVATVAIEVEDNRALEELREREIHLRDEITSILETIPMTTLVRLGARDTVKARVSAMLAHYVHEGTARVYVPQFVLQ